MLASQAKLDCLLQGAREQAAEDKRARAQIEASVEILQNQLRKLHRRSAASSSQADNVAGTADVHIIQSDDEDDDEDDDHRLGGEPPPKGETVHHCRTEAQGLQNGGAGERLDLRPCLSSRIFISWRTPPA